LRRESVSVQLKASPCSIQSTPIAKMFIRVVKLAHLNRL